MIELSILMVLAIASLGGLAAWFIAGRISQPLLYLKESARNIASGAFPI